MSTRISGIGMTSQRTRQRMIARLREQGISDEAVLNVMNEIPRHIFVEEALASRAYDDCATEVYSVERLLPLLSKARRNVRELRVMNIRFKHADGHVGIPEGAPFDAIMVTAAATHVPDALKQQLAVGGRMIVPMGVEEQYLCVIERTRSGFAETRLDAVKFVPMLSGLS